MATYHFFQTNLKVAGLQCFIRQKTTTYAEDFVFLLTIARILPCYLSAYISRFDLGHQGHVISFVFHRKPLFIRV